MSFRLLAWMLLLTVFSIPVFAQMPSVQQPQPMSPPQLGTNPPVTDNDDAVTRMNQEVQKKAEQERVVQLKSDTDKLLKLSAELKAYVDKTNANVLSLDVIKKAEQIEKLAKSVKDKMRGPN